MLLLRLLWVGLAVLLAACQLADEPSLRPPAGDGSAVDGEDAVGTQRRGLPATLAGMQERAAVPAGEWQPEPRLSEVWVAVGEDGQPQRARLAYLAADADRLLVVHIDEAGGIALEQLTLETLELAAVTTAGMEALPPLPESALDPAELAAAAEPALDDCELEPPASTLVYTTGAPMAWDGERWTQEPEWTFSVHAADGGVVVDPTEGAATGSCFSAAGS